MADSRDTNHDGKVSLIEKVKDKLHMGHKDSSEYSTTSTTHTTSHTHTSTTHTHTTAAVPVVGTGVAAVPVVGVAAVPVVATGAVATGVVTTGAVATGAVATDYNAHHHGSSSVTTGHVHGSTGGVTRAETAEEIAIRLHEEQLAISKRQVSAGEVGIHKHVTAERVEQTVPVRREEVTVERRALSGVADPNARIAAQDETIRVALTKEEVIAEKRVVPTEEVIVRKQQVTDQQTVGATLRSEVLDTTQLTATNVTTTGAAYDSRDKNHDGHVSGVEKVQGALKK